MLLQGAESPPVWAESPVSRGWSHHGVAVGGGVTTCVGGVNTV